MQLFPYAILTGACILAIWNEKLMIAWCSNTVLWAYLLWEMFSTLCAKLDTGLMGIHTILFGKVEEVVIKKKADDEPKAKAEAPEQK